MTAMSRAEIFANIKTNLKINLSDSHSDKKRRALVLNRIQSESKHIIPKRSITEPDELVRRFVSRAMIAGTEIIECQTLQNVTREITNWLAKNKIHQLRCATSQLIDDLAWPNNNISLVTGTASVDDKASLTGAFSGIAETGTLMLFSAEETPTLQLFLPDFHLVVLKSSQIVGPYEHAWKRLQQKFPQGLPRNVNLITGPSRSADIEQTLLMGAHGPKKLVIFWVDK
jgi:L-lactate dehydrogenase complex protein LldG